MTSTLTVNNNKIPFVTWLLRKETSTLSVKSMIRDTQEVLQSNASTLSLPLSLMTSSSAATASTFYSSSSTAASNRGETAMEQAPDKPLIDDTQPPPSYDDPSHPWIYNLPTSLANRTALPREEEEGNESLPAYKCTLNKVACVHVKCEFVKHNVKARNRSWRNLYIQVYGTKIMAFQRSPVKSNGFWSLTTAFSSLLLSSPSKNVISPIWSYSMQDAEVQIAKDYIKYHHVLRLTINEGPQFLFTFKSHKDKFEWLFALESSIDISSDIDVRPMPKAMSAIHRTSGRRGRRRRQRQQDDQRATNTNVTTR